MEKKKFNFIEFVKEAFNNDKKRTIATLMAILPFVFVMAFFGFKIYQEAKGLIGLTVDESQGPVSNAYQIKEKSFILRDNATELQKTYFAELKDLYENNTGTEEVIVISTAKNFIADFYTWSNKVGQYDVGGMYYVYTPQRHTVYIQARDQFYQYLSNYINQYGSDALLEVEGVEASVVGNTTINVDEEEFDGYQVSANWTYVQKEGGFQTSSYDKKAYLVIVENGGRFEIVYIGNEEYHENEEN